MNLFQWGLKLAHFELMASIVSAICYVGAFFV